MPMKSESQRRFLHAKYPEMAKRWEKETPKKKLPEHKEAPSVKEYLKKHKKD